MKKTSKIISVFMVAIMTLSIFAVSASAVATPLVAGNTKETATNIPSYGTEYVSELSKEGEQDWFKFTTLSQDAYYTIALENYSIPNGLSNVKRSVNLFVYDIYSKELVHIYNNSSKNIKLEKNTTYYIKVLMGSERPYWTGNYEISISYTLDPVSDIMSESTAINLNHYFTYSLDGTGDVDWFKFITTNSDSYTVSIANISLPNGLNNINRCVNLFIYDADLKELVHIYNNASKNIKLEENTTYYIKITMGNERPQWTGNYGFSVTCNSTKSLSKITIDSVPTKTTYAIGESFDQTGLEVTAHYSDGSTKAVTSCTVYGFDSSKAGTNTITISYTENGVTKTADFDVTITDASTPVTGFDFMSILTAIWNFFVEIFNFIIGLFAQL